MTVRPIAALPALSPGMLLPRAFGRAVAFPFCDKRTKYFYLARGAVFHAIRSLGLVGADLLVPAYHHGVEVEALVAAGARPVFYNVTKDFKADLASIAKELTPETRGLYVIHYAGFPQPMRDLVSFARAHGLKVIEDCALSLLSADGAQPLGTRGDAAVYCLYKTLPVPHGGALWMPGEVPEADLTPCGASSTVHQVASGMLAWAASASPAGEVVKRGISSAAKFVRSIRPLPVDAKPVGGRTYAAGQEKLAPSALTVQIARNLDAREVVEARRRNYYALMARLREVSPPMVHELEAGVSPLFYPMWVDDKRRLQAALAAEKIDSIDFWREGSPLVTPGKFPDVEELRAHVLELPIHQDVTTEDIDRMAEAVKRILNARTPRLLQAAPGPG